MSVDDYARKDLAGQWQHLIGNFSLIMDGETFRFDLSAIGGVDPAVLAANDIAAIAKSAAPADVIVAGWTLIDDAGVPTQAWTTAEHSLADLKALLKKRAEEIRDAHLTGGCETPYGRIKNDLENRLDLSGAVQMADKIGSAFTIEWPLAGGGRVTLDDGKMSEVGLFVGQHRAQCFAAFDAIIAAIDAATTRAAAAPRISRPDTPPNS